jgi:hypothetical protein
VSEVGVEQRRFDERLGPLFLGIVFFGGIVVWMAWEMFVRGGRPEMNLQFLNPTTDNPLSWFVVVAGSFMVLLGLWRLLLGRDVVVLEDDRVVFGYGGRKVLPRGAVAEVEVLPPDAVRLHLRDDVDEATRRRAGVKDPQQTWAPLAGQFRDAEQLPPAVEAWFAGR